MVKKRVFRGKSNAALAQDAAREVVQKREALKKLNERDTLLPIQSEEAAALVRQIKGLKAKIMALGFNPWVAISAAAALMLKESLKGKSKGARGKVGRRKGGVGVYSLGPSRKVWR